MAERIVRANGVDLCVEAFGDPGDADVLLIAGAASSMLHWPEPFCEGLTAGGRHVIRYDHRDTGRSVTYPPGDPGYAAGDLVADAVGVLDALGVERAHVVGVSMGGGMAQVLAGEHPDRFASLTAMSTSPLAPAVDLPPPEPELMAALGALEEPDWGDREAVIEHLVAAHRPYCARSRPVPEDFLRDLAARTVDRSASIASAGNHHLAPAGDDAPDAPVEVPTLVVHGDEDPLFPLAHGQALAAALPGAQLVVLEGTGHELPPRTWDMAVEAILAHTGAM